MKNYGFENIIVVHKGCYYEGVHDFHGIFRVKHYPRKKLFNLRGVLRFTRKRKIYLNEDQISKIKEFFQKYPGGMIDFG